MKYITIFLCLLPVFLLSQSEEWGVVPSHQLEMSKYEKDSSAEAIVLFDVANIEISHEDYRYYFKRHIRIKLLEASSLERGNISINYLAEDDYEHVFDVEAQVIQKDGSIHVLQEEDLFREINESKYSKVKFALPKLGVGAVIEYRYTLRSRNLYSLREWHFQYDIPVVYSKLSVKTPETLTYNHIIQGSKNITKVADGTYRYFEDSKLVLGNGIYEMWDVPAVKEESYMSCYEDYRAKIRFQVDKVYEKHAGELILRKTIQPTWQEIASELEDKYLFGHQYKRMIYHNRIVRRVMPIVNGIAKSKKEKAKMIYDYLAEHVVWNEEYGLYANDRLNKLLDKKLANKSSLNFMLLALLNKADIEAYPVLTSTRSHGKIVPEYVTKWQFNYVLVQVIMEGDTSYLDLGDPLQPMNLMSKAALNNQAWVLNGEDSYWIKLEVPYNRETIQVKCSLEGTDILGGIKTRTSTYSAMEDRSSYDADQSGNYWKKNVIGLEDDFEISNFEVKYLDELEKDFQAQFDFSMAGQVFENEDYLYISPILSNYFSEHPFKAEKRYSDIDFAYPFSDRYLFELDIPEGYKVEALPENVNLALPNKGGRFSYSCDEKDGKIHIHKLIRLDQTIFSPAEYNTIKTMFDLIIEKQGEQIVLVKEGE